MGTWVQSSFLHHFVLAKLATSSIRIKEKLESFEKDGTSYYSISSKNRQKEKKTKKYCYYQFILPSFYIQYEYTI